MENEEIIEKLEQANEEVSAEEAEVAATEDETVTQEEYSEQDYYSAIAEEDLKTLKASFSELKNLGDISELENPIKFARLRDSGLSAVEAYLECTKRKRYSDNRSHLTTPLPMNRARSTTAMSRDELEMARELFPHESDAEIQKLYKSVTR